MYESDFGFRERPFPAAPATRLFVPTESIEQARTTVLRTVDRAEGPALIIGPAGSGKSLLCQLVAEHYRDTYRVAMLASARLCTRRALLQNILFELKLPYRDMEEGELRLSLIDHLEPSDDDQPGMLLVVDEGHTMPLRLLEEIRMITNLVRDGQPRVRLVVAGGPQLEERFANPKLESLNQRIAARCYLQPLSSDETRVFIQSQVERVGGQFDQCFAEDAVQAVFRASDGIPRLINQICDHALILASVAGAECVDAKGIEEAWADLQQLPTPWNGANLTSEPTESVVEFGQLDDDELCGPGVVGEEDVNVSWTPPEEQVELRLAPATLADGETSDDGRAKHGRLTETVREFAAFDVGHVAEADPVVVGDADPFDEAFDEEEVIIDQFAMLDAALENALPVFQPRVAGVASLFDSFRIEAGATTETPRPRALVDLPEADQVVDEPPASIAINEPPATIGVDESENTDAEPAESAPQDATNRGTSHRQPCDDRDLIIVEDDETFSSPPHEAPARAYREQYAQLFGRLRKR